MNGFLAALLTALHDNISAVFALAGVALGALLSFLSSHALEKREAEHRVTEKVLDRRIEAHEEIARWAESLGGTYVIGYDENDEETEVVTPVFMCSPDAYVEWRRSLGELTGRYAVWLSAATDEQIKILDTYLYELEALLRRGRAENIWAIGAIVSRDLCTLMTRIQNTCYRYLSRDLLRLELPLMTVFVSPHAVSRRRNQLTGFLLISERQTIERLVKTDPSEIEQKLGIVLFEHFKEQLQKQT